jgi:hypothetical protein
LIKPTAPKDKAEQSMKKADSTFKIVPAQLHDQKIIRILLSVFKLPLDGLEETKLWVLQSSNGEVIGVAGLEVRAWLFRNWSKVVIISLFAL